MELTTIAKPYANAIFEIAEQGNNHSSWHDVLHAGAQLANDETVQAFIASPSATKDAKADAIKGLFGSVLDRSLSTEENAFVTLLLDNARISALPSMLALFEAMSNQGSDTKTFDVISAYELSASQQQQLIGDLSRKYNTTISINVVIDENLLGGVMIKEGDKVIDLSIQARVNTLGTRLSVN